MPDTHFPRITLPAYNALADRSLQERYIRVLLLISFFDFIKFFRWKRNPLLIFLCHYLMQDPNIRLEPLKYYCENSNVLYSRKETRHQRERKTLLL